MKDPEQTSAIALYTKQGVYDRNGECIANTLSMGFQGDDTEEILPAPPETLTKAIIANTFAAISIDELSDHKPLYLPFHHQDLVDGFAQLLPKDKIIVVVSQKALQYEAVLQATRKLKSKGYRIALKDFYIVGKPPVGEDMVSQIQIDLSALNKTELEAQLFLLKRRNGATLIATGIHDEATFEYSKTLEFEYFQGNFLCQPHIFSDETIGIYHSSLLNIITEVSQSSIEVEEITHLLSQDPTLSYRVMLIVNSAYYRGITPIKSLQQAVVRMGLQAIKNWILLLSIKKFNHKPTALIELTIQRARMCELLAQHYLSDKVAECFTLGLLSTLDALLDRSLFSLMSQLSLGTVFKKALLHHEGRMGKLLADVIHYQQGNFEAVSNQYIPLKAFALAYPQAVSFAKEMMAL